jgi:integrase
MAVDSEHHRAFLLCNGTKTLAVFALDTHKAIAHLPLPAGADVVKFEKRVGFHTFRHTYTTLLTQNNEEVKVVQEFLRHANSGITLDLYAQAGMPNKRLAQSKLVRLVLKGEAQA